MLKKSPKIALLIESSRNYGRGVLRGIASYAHAHGPWSCHIQERELHSRIPEWVRSWRGDGIIARIEDRVVARALLRCGCPVVDVLGNEVFEKIPGFDTDAAAVARLVADFFLRAGFRHLAFCGFAGIPFSERRAAAFLAQLAARGHRVHEFAPPRVTGEARHIQAIEQRGLAAERSIAAWLRRLPRPVAVFACNDIRGQQVLNACREYQIRVPEDVAVIGVDNDDVLCTLCEPPLSSVLPDTEKLGYEAAALLDRMIQSGRVTAKGVQIPPLRIIQRASTDTVATEDPVTVQAVRFIRENVCRGIAVKDVLAHTGRSRTDLEQRFRLAFNSSLRREIMRCRLERVSVQLVETKLKLEEIARLTGFSSAGHLCRLFKKHRGLSPSQYRNG